MSTDDAYDVNCAYTFIDAHELNSICPEQQ